MAIAIGTKLGSHEIITLLGKGGMGEVYRARDLKLNREVAIKILPDEKDRSFKQKVSDLRIYGLPSKAKGSR
jgi:serine/threonine protein kinase